MKKLLKSPYTITILGGLIVLVIWSLISDYMSGDRLLTMLTNIWIWIYSAILSFLNFNIKVWWLLIAIFALIAILCVVVKISEFKEQLKPEWFDYTSDIIDGFHWRWIWEKQYDGKYAVENLHILCSECETPLIVSWEHGGRLCCPRCKKQMFGNTPEERNVKTLIYDNVDKMTPKVNK